MDSKSKLLERYRLYAEQCELDSTLNYLQLRNRDLVRDWRMKFALSALATGAVKAGIPPTPA